MRAAESYDVRARRMFNGMGIYTGEKMFAYLYDEEIGLKLSPDDLSQAMSLPGAGPLIPDPNSDPMREYVKMPPAGPGSGLSDWLTTRSASCAKAGSAANASNAIAPRKTQMARERNVDAPRRG